MKRLFSLFCSILSIVAIWGNERYPVVVGAEQYESYFPLIKDKRIALFSNHTGMVGDKHILDILVKNGMNVVAVFAPEHGFRGDAGAGDKIENETDPKTGIRILSLYNGNTKSPEANTIKEIDILMVDIQDVGLRFYTYYITMIKLMEVCAEQGKKVIILDRPNPNGHCVDGPILDMKYKSAVGWLPIPVVHGLTLGELALMANGEKWLRRSLVCDVTVISCENYSHQTLYELPIPPSPNLPNMTAVYLYPSLCYFEGTSVSLGRGTPFPFQVYGHPAMSGYDFCFTPRSLPEASNPPQKGKTCYGVDLRDLSREELLTKGVDLSYVIDAYQKLDRRTSFFRPFFENLIGVGYVRQMIKQGKSAAEIKAMWQDDVKKFKKQRKPYLLYEE